MHTGSTTPATNQQRKWPRSTAIQSKLGSTTNKAATSAAEERTFQDVNSQTAYNKWAKKNLFFIAEDGSKSMRLDTEEAFKAGWEIALKEYSNYCAVREGKEPIYDSSEPLDRAYDPPYTQLDIDPDFQG